MKQPMRKPLALLLCAAMLLSLLPFSAIAQEAKDMDGHWSADAVALCAEYGIMSGYEGYFRPNDPITRAEFCAMVNRTYGITDTANAPVFSDVPEGAWYADDLAAAAAMGYLSGVGGGRVAPNLAITREEAFTILARIYSLNSAEETQTSFADDRELSDWARASVSGMAQAGYVQGSGGNLRPGASITRGEAAKTLCNLFGAIADENTGNESHKNLTVRKAGVTLKGTNVQGDLLIADGVGQGDVFLNGVTVAGRTLISGGGAQSVQVKDAALGVVVLSGRQSTHLDMSESTTVSRVYLNASGAITHGAVSVGYNVGTGVMSFGGKLDEIALHADGTATVTVAGLVYDIIPIKTANAPGTSFALAADAVVANVIVNAPVLVTGTGKIETMEIHSPGVVIDASVNVKPENITVDEGLTIRICDREFTGSGGPLSPGRPSGGGGGSGSGSVAVTGVTLSLEDVTLSLLEEENAKTLLLIATVSPANASNQGVIWSSSDETVATVDASGLVTALAEGKAEITAKTENGGYIATATVRVLAELDRMVEAKVLTAYASYNPYEEMIYLDWVSTEPDNAFEIHMGHSDDSLAKRANVSNAYSYSIDASGITADTYLEVTQPLAGEEPLSSGVMMLDFDNDGIFVPDEEEESMNWLGEQVEDNPTILDADNDGLTDAMEERLADEGYGSFDPKNPTSIDGSTLDGDVILDYIHYLENPPKDFKVWLKLKIPAKYIDLLSLVDEAADNPFFGEDIYGYIGAPAVRIDFPAALLAEVKKLPGQEISLHFALSGDAAGPFLNFPDQKAGFTYFNDLTQVFEEVVFTETKGAGTYTMTAVLDHFSYYTVLNATQITLPEPNPDFKVEEAFKDANTPTDILILAPTVLMEDSPWGYKYPPDTESVPYAAARRFIGLFGDKLKSVGIPLYTWHTPKTGNSTTLAPFSNDKDSIFRPGGYPVGIQFLSYQGGLPEENLGPYIARALSLYFDPEYLPEKGYIPPGEEESIFLFNYIDGSFKSTAPKKAMVVIAYNDEIKGLTGDSPLLASEWSGVRGWVNTERTGTTGGKSGVAPQTLLDEFGVDLYLVAYGGPGYQEFTNTSGHPSGSGDPSILESYKTNADEGCVHTFYAQTEEELNAVLDKIAYDIATVDVTTDSNGDGISDFFTKRICEGSLRLGTGAQITDDEGKLLDYNKFQNGDGDYDGDGIPNNEEIAVVFDTDGYPYLVMKSNPGRKDTNGNGINDADDPKPLVAWKATTALARIVENAGFIYLEKGVNYNNRNTGAETGDFLYARIDARQKGLGYCYAYDESIMAVSSAILCEPIYFFYDGKEWMIEMWKGQYGIETGAEIGVYNRQLNDTNMGKHVASNIAKMIEEEARAVFGSLVKGDPGEGIFNAVMKPVRAIAGETSDTLVTLIDKALAVVRSGVVYGPMKLLLGQDRADAVVNAVLAAKNFVSCKFYQCVPDEEFLELSIKLTNLKDEVLFERNKTDHWWLTGFKWGEFTGDLGAIKCELTVTFKDADMKEAFLNGMPATDSADYTQNFERIYEKMMLSVPRRLDDNNNDNDRIYGISARGYKVTPLPNNTISFTFQQPKTTQPYAAMLNPAVLAWNRVLVSSYNALLEVLEIETTDPNAIEERLLDFDNIFDEDMFEAYKTNFGGAVPLSLRKLSYSQLSDMDKLIIKAKLTEAQKDLFVIIDSVSNAIFTIADKIVGPEADEP